MNKMLPALIIGLLGGPPDVPFGCFLVALQLWQAMNSFWLWNIKRQKTWEIRAEKYAMWVASWQAAGTKSHWHESSETKELRKKDKLYKMQKVKVSMR